MAGERDVRIRFTGEAKALKGTAGEVRQLFSGMIDDVDDMRLAGDKLGDAMKQAADKAAQELEGLRSTVMVVSDALGPEMVEALDKSGRGVDELVLDWKKLGLTYDDIKLSADQLASGVKALDTSARASTDSVGAGLQKVSREGDNSRSVLANMVGNSAQDLGALGGVAGTAGMAIGQLAEYATEGNIKLSNLAKVAAPMGLMAAAMWAVSKGAEQAAKRSKEFSESIDDLMTVTDDQALRILGDAMMRAALEGESLEGQMKQIAEQSPEGAQRLLDVALAAGYTEEQMKILIDAIAEKEAADKRGEENTRKYGESMDAAAVEAEGFAAATEEAGHKSQYLADSVKAANDKLLAQIGIMGDAEESTINTKQAYEDYAQQLEDAKSVQDDSSTKVNEADRAMEDLRLTQLGLAGQMFDTSAKVAEQSGALQGSAEYAAIQRAELKKMQDQYPLLRAEIQKYIDKLDAIPANVNTRVTINGQVVQDNTSGKQGGNSPTIGTAAGGTPSARSGTYLVGEEGPELVTMRGGESVLPADQTRAALAGSGDITIVFSLGDEELKRMTVRQDQLRKGTR